MSEIRLQLQTAVLVLTSRRAETHRNYISGKLTLKQAGDVYLSLLIKQRIAMKELGTLEHHDRVRKPFPIWFELYLLERVT